MDRSRHYQDGLPVPITYHDIEVWGRVTGKTIRPHHVEALMDIEQAYRSELVEAIAYSQKRKQKEERK